MYLQILLCRHLFSVNICSTYKETMFVYIQGVRKLQANISMVKNNLKTSYKQVDR